MKTEKMQKGFKTKTLEIISKVILKTAAKEANSACLFLSYQPKTPADLKKLRKF